MKSEMQDVYKGCCESINVKDTNTKHKHWFTNQHCGNLPKKYEETELGTTTSGSKLCFPRFLGLSQQSKLAGDSDN